MKIISEKDAQTVKLATAELKAGNIISFATDTVYGLACDASNEKAVEKLYDLKKRQDQKPIVIFLPNIFAAKEIFIFNQLTEKIVNDLQGHSPTIVLRLKDNIQAKLADNLNKNHDKFLGFRIVNQQFINDLLENFNGILAVTSANISGQEASISAAEVEKYFLNSNLSLLIDGGICKKKIASTVIKIDQQKIEVLRAGNISPAIINAILNYDK